MAEMAGHSASRWCDTHKKSYSPGNLTDKVGEQGVTILSPSQSVSLELKECV